MAATEPLEVFERGIVDVREFSGAVYCEVSSFDRVDCVVSPKPREYLVNYWFAHVVFVLAMRIYNILSAVTNEIYGK